jgi:hypothetical protein
MEFNDRVIIFELKTAAEDEDLEAMAFTALAQIDKRRYGADLDKPLLGVGFSFRKKQCRVRAIDT